MIIGTRKSKLALAQTELVVGAIKAQFPDVDIQIEKCETAGDIKLQTSLADLGGKGAFTEDIERELLAGTMQMAVHSAKDLPITLPEDLQIGAVLKRGDSRDLWVVHQPMMIKEAPQGTVVGTGSKRRQLQVAEINTGVVFKDIRGNVQTRLQKLVAGEYGGIILAAAGLKRLGLIDETTDASSCFELDGNRFYYQYLPDTMFLPAAGQGIIAIESKKDGCTEILDAINDEETMLMMTAERAFLEGIGGGCNEAAAISSKIMKNHLILTAKYAPDDQEMEMALVRKGLSGDRQAQLDVAREAGLTAARRLMKE